MKNILIIDDDNDFRNIVKDVLLAEGFVTTDAADGLSAIRVFQSCQPDAVILDHHMPFMKGIETLREIKKINPRVPVIMITASEDATIAAEAYKFGACDFISKPPEFKHIIIAVKRALQLN